MMLRQQQQLCSAIPKLEHRTIIVDKTAGIPQRLLFNDKITTRYMPNIKENVAKMGWPFHFFDDFACEHHLHAFGLAAAFRDETDGRLKSDMCRLAMLYLFGGWYLDSDIVIEKFDDQSFAEFEFVSANTTSYFSFNPPGIFNAIIGSVAGHSILLDAMQRLKEWYEHRQLRAEVWRVTRFRKRHNGGTVLLKDSVDANGCLRCKFMQEKYMAAEAARPMLCRFGVYLDQSLYFRSRRCK